MAAELRPSHLNKACLIDFYVVNITILKHFVWSESDFKAWN